LAREQREKRAANPNKKNWSDSFWIKLSLIIKI
jgi:hypothetical protein